MPKIAVLILSLFFSVSLAAQPKSYLGNVHTPKGDLHMLVIFVRYDERCLMKDDDQWPDSSEEGVLPKIARGNLLGGLPKFGYRF